MKQKLMDLFVKVVKGTNEIDNFKWYRELDNKGLSWGVEGFIYQDKSPVRHRFEVELCRSKNNDMKNMNPDNGTADHKIRFNNISLDLTSHEFFDLKKVFDKRVEEIPNEKLERAIKIDAKLLDNVLENYKSE